MSETETPRRVGRSPIEAMAEGERRAEILSAAGALFRARGYAAVSLAGVAAAVGVTKATILHNFGSKAGLYDAVMRDTLERIGASIRGTASGDEPIAVTLGKLAHVGIVVVDADADLDAMMHDVAEHLSPTAQEGIAAAHRSIMEAVEDLMRDGIARGELAEAEPAFLAHAFWHLVGSFGWRPGAAAGFQGRPEVARAVVALFLNGAGRRASGP